jgi:hypothetical protein
VGTWGTGIFENDLAVDVEAAWSEAIGRGVSPADATDGVIASLGADVIDDQDDGPVFWLALATLQMDAHALDATVREHAQSAISQNLARWRDEASKSDAAEREHVLNELGARLSLET